MVFRTFTTNGAPRRRGSLGIGLLIAAVALISYCSSQEFNAVTGKKQYLAMSPQQEIALGLETAPVIAQEYGGISASLQARAHVSRIGSTILRNNAADVAGWRFQFHLLADPQTINAFALPGGQVFITEGLYRHLKNDAQLSGVLSHEIGHVVGRHGAAQLAKHQLTQGLTGAVAIASGDTSSGQIAAMAGQLMNLRYGREDELESDTLAIRFMARAGYEPRAMLDVLNILAQAGGSGGPEFFSTHPNPANRLARLELVIAQHVDGTSEPTPLTER